MPRQWTEDENQVFIKVIGTYKDAIRGKDMKQVDKLTRSYADRLYEEHPVLKENRTPEAVYQHLSYFDDLLAGVGSKEQYAQKDAKHFGTVRRPDGNLSWNLAKRRGYKARLAEGTKNT